MTPEQYQRLKALFNAALTLPTREREQYLDEHCGDDPALRTEVESLLAQHDAPTGSMLQIPAGERVIQPQGSEGLLGQCIGSYRILDVIGRGGMGVVYRAEQEHPRRIVALKVIHSGAASPAILSRFEHEAQTLGRLQHPGIAHVYEAGVFESGGGLQPFFAMEFIEGEHLTAFADKRNLGTRQRLELLVRICQAVQHAHQKGIIHRDLKPGNILVTKDGEPKILDFGVARATDSDVQTATLRTDIGQLIGTIPYMSPEQAGGNPDELDTRSDVYALGVVAYELLAGRLPHDLREKMIHEAVRVIREDDPTPLSSINRTLRGDVEIIIGKALEKEKERRYASASDFASDIDRYLHDQPIVARPPSAAYQFRKFTRRNKTLVGGVAATFLVLLLGLIGTTTYAKREVQQRQIAEENAQRAEREASRAETEMKRALAAEAQERARAVELSRVAEFQASQLAGIETELMGSRIRRDIIDRRRAFLLDSGLGDTEIEASLIELEQSLAGVNFTNIALERIREDIFDRALAAIEAQFADQPLVRANLLASVADTLLSLGLLEGATAPRSQALEIHRRVLGDEHPETLTSISKLGTMFLHQGKATEAEPHLREALAGYRRVLGDEHQHTLTTITNLGKLLYQLGRHVEAETFFHEALQGYRRILGDEHPDTLSSLNNLAIVLMVLDRFAEAEQRLREIIELQVRILGDAHPVTLTSINNLGATLRAQGKLAEAERYYREALEGRRRVLGDEHPDTLGSVANMAFVLRAQGRLSEAERYARVDLDACRRLLGPHHPDTIISIGNLAGMLRELGQLDEAGRLGAEAVEASRHILGEQHWLTAATLSNHGRTLAALEQFAEAQTHLLEAYAIFKAALGPLHGRTTSAIEHLAELYDAWHEREQDSTDRYQIKGAEWRAKLQVMQEPPHKPAPAELDAPADGNPADLSGDGVVVIDN